MKDDNLFDSWTSLLLVKNLKKDSSLVRVESMASEWEANLLVHRLEDEGVRASATGGYTAGFIAEAPGFVGVLVDSRDETRARGIIRGYFDEKKQRAHALLDGQGHDPSAAGGANAFEKQPSRVSFWVSLFVLLSLVGAIVPLLVSFPLMPIVALTIGVLGIAFWFRRFCA